MKKLVSLLLALSLLLGCAAALAGDYYPAEKVSYNVWIRMRPMNGNADDMEIFKIMEEKTNVHLNFEQIPQADWEEKILQNLNGGKDLPDAYYSGYSLNSTQLLFYAGQGLLLPLNDLIEQYMPNFKAKLEAHPEVKAAITAPDGNIYSLPFCRFDGLTGQIPSNMFINKVWLDKLNLSVPTTVEELETVLTAFKENDCNGDGNPNDEIPMTFKFEGSQRDLGGLFGMFGYADNLYGGQHHFCVDDGKVIFTPATEGYKKGCAYLYEHFFSKGLIDLEGFTMDKATYNAQNQGELANIGAYFSWNIFDLGSVHMDEYVPMAPLLGPDGTTSWGYVTSSGIETVGLVLTKDCKDPVNLIKWADLTYDDFYGMQLEYGCIGTNIVELPEGDPSGYKYDYVREYPDGMTYDEFLFGNTYPDSCLALFRDFYETILPMPDSAKAKDKINNEMYLPVATTRYYPTLLFSAEDNDRINEIAPDIIGKAEEMRAEWLARGGVEDQWDDYLATLNAMGLQEYIDIYQKTYDNAYGK
ncbi:MAG: extracellular solute-binding protein [Clostridia bacterium]|nr:extracellular solute-binding protein [Clostridia bacterium]